MKIAYLNGSGVIENPTGSWHITAKPALGFLFDGISANDETNLAVKYFADGGRERLSDAEIALTRAYVTAQVKPAAPAPTPEEIALAAQIAADNNAALSAKANAVIQYLTTHTPAECDAYVQANVTTLAQAKTMLGNFAIALCVLTKITLR
jgi:hypothetical protein